MTSKQPNMNGFPKPMPGAHQPGHVHERRIDIYEYLNILISGKWIILGTFVAILVATTYYTWTRPFVYEAKAKMLISSKKSDGAASLFVGLGGGEERNLKNELEVMKSKPLMNATAETLLRRKFLDSNSHEVLPILLKGEKTPKHQTPQLSSSDEIADKLNRIVQLAAIRDADVVEVKVLSNNPYEAAIIANAFVHTYSEDNENNSRLNARKLRQFLEDQVARTQDTLSRAEGQLQDYMSSNNAVQVDEQSRNIIQKMSDFDSKYNEARINAESRRKALNEYRGQLKQIEPEFSDNIAAAASPYIESLQKQIAELEVQRDFMVAKDEERGSEVAYQNFKKDIQRRIDELKANLRVKTEELRKSKLGSVPAPTGRSMSGALSPTESLNYLKQKIFENSIELQAEEARVAALAEARAQAEGDFRRIPAQVIELARLSRASQGADKLFTLLSEKYNEATIAEQSVFGSVRIFEPATPNVKPVSPNRTLNMILGAVIGFALGIGVVIFKSLADSRIRTPEELENRGFVVLAAIPKIPLNLTAADALNMVEEEEQEFYRKLPPDKMISSHLITHLNPKSPIAESYRSIRTAIQFAGADRQVKVVLVSSSVPQEGKSTTASNIAITLAQTGNRTIIVDCDLRRPVVHNTYNTGKEPGLVNILVGRTSIEDAIRPTGIKNLDILTSGPIPPNPSELLGSRSMHEFLEKLATMYDSIILDTPPIVAVTDAIILSKFADAYILVARANVTHLEIVQKSRESIERVSSKMLGVVLNDFDIGKSYGSYYKYYRYYKYYNYYGDNSSSEDGGKKKNIVYPAA